MRSSLSSLSCLPDSDESKEKFTQDCTPDAIASAEYPSATNASSEEQNNIVSWSGPHDPENPRNWSKERKWVVTIVVSLYTFISPVASSISSPSLPAISRSLDVPHGSVLESMMLSIFVLAYALGPLVWGPLSELFGRLVILQISNAWFLVFNTLCAFAKTPTQLLVFRFLAGFGGAAPQSIGGGVVGDLWSPEERGTAMSLYSLAPLVGPSTGPFVGGWIAQKSRWQWVFWSVSIADALLQIVGLFLLQETYAPELLRRRARNEKQQAGDGRISSAFDRDLVRSRAAVMGRGVVKPLSFLVTEPIIQIFALYMAVLYGVLYLSLTDFVNVFTERYDQDLGVAGTHYLSIAVGSTVGGQLGAHAHNVVYRRLKAKNSGMGNPEMRLPLLMVSVNTLPVGLLIYGWTTDAHSHWVFPDLGVFIYSIGIGGNWTCIQTYLVDNYALHAASAIAGVVSFRAFAGFGFPLFAETMYKRMGYGWGNSVLALICLVIGCPPPFLLYRYGSKLREWSRAASVEQ